MKNHYLGTQYILELYGCNQLKIDNIISIEEIMLKAAKASKATIIEHHFHKFAPQGVSGSIIIAESHINIHTWPEHGYAAIDIFSCGNSLKPLKALDVLYRELNAVEKKYSVIPRGDITMIDQIQFR